MLKILACPIIFFCLAVLFIEKSFSNFANVVRKITPRVTRMLNSKSYRRLFNCLIYYAQIIRG